MRDRRPAALAGLLLVALALLALLAPPASGQAGTERITSYNVEIQVEPTGSLLITETIDYDFVAHERHGIYRDIPVRLGWDSRYERIYPLDVLSVEGSQGTPDEYQTENGATTSASGSATPTAPSPAPTATPCATGSTMR